MTRWWPWIRRSHVHFQKVMAIVMLKEALRGIYLNQPKEELIELVKKALDHVHNIKT